MDSLTQAVLGGAIGESVVGRNEGNRAVLWGAIAGTVPDLDILLYPWLDEVQELAVHRSLTHSLFFAIVMAPIAGYLLRRIYPRSSTPWQRWAWMVFLGLSTHSLLDCFTQYGTQVFYPFSNYPVSFDSISVIDPLYTILLAIGLGIAMVSRSRPGRSARANGIGLALSTLYLLLTLPNKAYVTGRFESSLAARDISYERLFTNPSLLNNVLWYGAAETDSSFLIGTYSLFDEHGDISFQSVPKNHALLKPYLGQRPVERIRWFSKGYYAAMQVADTLFVNDVRFPRNDFWLDSSGRYMFSFRLTREGAEITGFELNPFAARPSGEFWRRYVRRIFGEK